jgi:hypothetical protein
VKFRKESVGMLEERAMNNRTAPGNAPEPDR